MSFVSPLHRFVARQLRQPSGAFGRVVMSRALNRGNAEQIESTLEHLGLGPDDDYLDLGFGGGRALRRAARRVTRGHLYGVDLSADMVATAQRRLRPLVAAGRLTLLQGDVNRLPLRDGLVSRISTVNTIYFWPDPEVGMAELRRILAPRGAVAIGFTGAEKMARYGHITRHDFRWYTPDEVATLARGAGFGEVAVHPLAGRLTGGDFVVTAR